MLAGVGGHLSERVLAIGIDAQDGHAAVGIILGELLEPWSVHFAQRAFDAEESEHDHLRVGIVRESVRLAAKVVERKLVELGAQRSLLIGSPIFGGRRQAGKCQRQYQRERACAARTHGHDPQRRWRFEKLGAEKTPPPHRPYLKPGRKAMQRFLPADGVPRTCPMSWTAEVGGVTAGRSPWSSERRMYLAPGGVLLTSQARR